MAQRKSGKYAADTSVRFPTSKSSERTNAWFDDDLDQGVDEDEDGFFTIDEDEEED
jgi:hypothetical protein